MSTYLTRLFFAFILALSTMITLNASYAFDEQTALKKFQTYAQENNIIFTFGSIEKPDNKTLIIKNADYFDEEHNSRQLIETIILSNVRESNSGTLHYDSVEVLNIKQKTKSNNQEFTVSFERVYSDGLKFSSDPVEQDVFWPSYTAFGELTNITIETNGDDQEVKLLFPSATVEGIEQTNLRNFIAKSVKLAPATGTVKTGKDETVAISLGAAAIENMKQFGTQGFDIGLIDIGAFNMTMKAKTGEAIDIVFDGMTIENLFSPDLSKEGSSIVSDKDLTAEIKPFSVTLDGKQLMGWKRGYVATKNDEAANTIKSDARIEAMYLDFSEAPQNPKNAEMLKTLQELDLVKMIINIEATGIWERDTGLLEISKYDIQLEDGATFGVSARVSGYTEDVARQFTKAINAMNSEPDENKKSAMALQAVAYLAGLSFQRMEIILDDQSLLNRVVNVQAKKLKQDPEQVKGIVGPMTTIMLTPYNIPELAAQASQALGTFMQGNKKLTITAEPKNGLAITEIIALSSGASAGTVTPADLAKRLNLTIKAE